MERSDMIRSLMFCSNCQAETKAVCEKIQSLVGCRWHTYEKENKANVRLRGYKLPYSSSVKTTFTLISVPRSTWLLVPDH